jgi:Polyketide cyclase / dehydrase and lipid transport
LESFAVGRWQAEASGEVAAEPAAVWELWEDPSRWSDWNPAIARAELEGPFAVGTRAVIRFHGRPGMKFDITAIDGPTLFVDETRLPGARMGHEHRLAQRDGHVLVTHRIYFDGPLAPMWGVLMGRRIRRDLASFVARERRLCERPV